MMSVSEGELSLSVAKMGGGGFSLSMIVRRVAVTARMSCGLKKVVLVRVVGFLRSACGGGTGSSACRGSCVRGGRGRSGVVAC